MKLDKEQSKRNELASHLNDVTKSLKGIKLEIGGLCLGGALVTYLGLDAFFTYLGLNNVNNNDNPIITIFSAIATAASPYILYELNKKYKERKEIKECFVQAKKELTDEVSKIDMLDEHYKEISDMFKKRRK